jgi:hypothetical protein
MRVLAASWISRLCMTGCWPAAANHLLAVHGGELAQTDHLGVGLLSAGGRTEVRIPVRRLSRYRGRFQLVLSLFRRDAPGGARSSVASRWLDPRSLRTPKRGLTVTAEASVPTSTRPASRMDGGAREDNVHAGAGVQLQLRRGCRGALPALVGRLLQAALGHPSRCLGQMVRARTRWIRAVPPQADAFL